LFIALWRAIMKIAVIGGGLSGATIIKTLLNHQHFKTTDQIDVFEKREHLGVGLAYDYDDSSVMLNVEPDLLSVHPDNPNDFIDWLKKTYKQPKNFEHLVSRPRYGRYLVE